MMKAIRIHYLIKLVLFWLAFFAVFRVLFILYHHARIPDGQHSQTSRSFYHALPADLAITAFLIIIPFILWIFQQYNKSRIIHRVNIAYHFTMISLMALLCIFNIKIYGEYDTLMTTEELAYLLYPKEAVTFLSLWSLLLLIAGSALFALLAIRAYQRFVVGFSYPLESNAMRLVIIVLVPVTIFVVSRKGLHIEDGKHAPSDYSVLKINNDIATNPVWYLAHSYRAGGPLQ